MCQIIGWKMCHIFLNINLVICHLNILNLQLTVTNVELLWLPLIEWIRNMVFGMKNHNLLMCHQLNLLKYAVSSLHVYIITFFKIISCIISSEFGREVGRNLTKFIGYITINLSASIV